MDEAARKRLLEPITDEQARDENLKLVSRQEIDDALRAVDRGLRPLETYARAPSHHPAVRYS
jgi:hypothetical protein